MSHDTDAFIPGEEKKVSVRAVFAMFAMAVCVFIFVKMS